MTFGPSHTNAFHPLNPTHSHINHSPKHTYKQPTTNHYDIIMCQHTQTVSVASMATVSTAVNTFHQLVNSLTYSVDCKKCGQPCSNGRKCAHCGAKN